MRAKHHYDTLLRSHSRRDCLMYVSKAFSSLICLAFDSADTISSLRLWCLALLFFTQAATPIAISVSAAHEIAIVIGVVAKKKPLPKRQNCPLVTVCSKEYKIIRSLVLPTHQLA